MSDYQFKSEDLLPYTPDTPDCPKCGGTDVRRHYRVRGKPCDEFWPFVDHEFLKLICQCCFYVWGQHVRYDPSKLVGTENE